MFLSVKHHPWSALASAAVIAGALLVSPAAARRSPRCAVSHHGSPSDDKVVGRSRYAIVYEADPLNPVGPLLTVCDERTGARRLIARNAQVGARPVFQGGVVAVQYYAAADSTRFNVSVLNFHTGRRLHTVQHACDQGGDGILGYGLVVNASGSTAWSCSNDTASSATPEIDALDSRGRRVVDRGPGIDVRSLRLTHAGHVLTWKVNGATESAPLN